MVRRAEGGGMLRSVFAWWGERPRSRVGHLLLFSVPVWPLLMLGLWLFFYFWAFSKLGPPVSDAAPLTSASSPVLLSTTRLLHRGRCFSWDMLVHQPPRLESARVQALTLCQVVWWQDLAAGRLQEVSCSAYDEYVAEGSGLEGCVRQLEEGFRGVMDWLARHDPQLVLVPVRLSPPLAEGEEEEEEPALYFVSVVGQGPGLQAEAGDLCAKVVGPASAREGCVRAVVQGAVQQLSDKSQPVFPGSAYHRRVGQQEEEPGEGGSQDVVVFWHVAVMDNDVWRAIMVEQLHALLASGLADRASRVVVSVVGGEGSREQARQVLEQQPHPHIKLWEEGAVAPPLWHYEWPTLQLLYDHCHGSAGQGSAAVLYLHSKGASRQGPAQHEAQVGAWRRLMEEFSVWRWPACLSAVTTHGFDTCGVQYDEHRNPSYAGNVWWASCGYVRRLVPLEQVPRFSRHSAEQWVGSVAQRRPLSCLQLLDEGGRLRDLYHRLVHEDDYRHHPGCDALLLLLLHGLDDDNNNTSASLTPAPDDRSTVLPLHLQQQPPTTSP